MRKITIKQCKQLKKEFADYAKEAEETTVPIINTLCNFMDITISKLNRKNINNKEIQKELNDMFSVIEPLMGKPKTEKKPNIFKRLFSKLKQIFGKRS